MGVCVAGAKRHTLAIGSAVTLVLALVIAVLTLMPMPMPTSAGPGTDKIYHMLAFASLAFPLPLMRPKLAIWVFLGVVAYGGMIEVIQPFFGRQAEWADLLADGAGAACGALAAWLLGRRLRRRRGKAGSGAPVTEAGSAET